MKINILKRIFYLSICLLALSGCKEDEAEIGEPYSKVEGLTATDWVISEVFLVDEGNPAKPERNISAQVVTTDPLELSFKTDGSFTANAENSFFPLNGTWSFDNDNTPKKIILVDSDGTHTDVPLGGPTRISDAQLKINFVKQSCPDGADEKAALGYRLVFNRK